MKSIILITVLLIVPFAVADTPPDAPRSPQAIDAETKHDAAVKKAKEAYRTAMTGADKLLIADLNTAMNAAMANKNADEVTRIAAAQKSAQEELAEVSGDVPSSIARPVLPLGHWRIKSIMGIKNWTVESDGVIHPGSAQKIVPVIDGPSFVFHWQDGWVERLTPQGSWLRYDGWAQEKAVHYQTETPDSYGIATWSGN